MATYVYDGSFDGLLSVVFDAFRTRRWPTALARAPLRQAPLFAEVLDIATDEGHARRVEHGLLRRAGPETPDRLRNAHRADRPGVPLLLFRYIASVFGAPDAGGADDWLAITLEVERLHHRLRAEVHRMHAFVRFEQHEDDFYVARIAPDFDVLDLVTPHFEARFPAQRWLIADVKRDYGMYYDGSSVHRVDGLPEQSEHAEEAFYRRLWRGYFQATTIEERRNLKLHLRHVPRRYWRYLTEKQPDLG